MCVENVLAQLHPNDHWLTLKKRGKNLHNYFKKMKWCGKVRLSTA